MRTRTPKRKCVLCGTALSPSPYEGIFIHSETPACQVAVADHLGISIDETYELVNGEVFARAADDPPADNALVEFGGTVFTVNGQPIITNEAAFYSTESAAKKMFEAADKPYLGGASGLRGWSSISTFQTCRYLWKSKYGGRNILGDRPGTESQEIGSLVHIFLALHYMRRIDSSYPIVPEDARRFFELAPVTPGYLQHAWLLFDAYRLHYGDESWMTPLAVEELAVDPRTGFSCRWDFVFRVEHPFENLLPGVFVANSKTAGDNGMTTREQWKNDGQILGEIDLYDRLGYHRRWGALRAACVNLLIKTKVPQFHRAWVYPPKAILRDHHKSLKVWTAEMDLAAATGDYRRSRASCVTKWRGLCELHDHCSGADGDAPREIEP